MADEVMKETGTEAVDEAVVDTALKPEDSSSLEEEGKKETAEEAATVKGDEGKAETAEKDKQKDAASSEAIPSMDDMKADVEASLKKQGGPKRADMEKWERLKDDLEKKLTIEVEVNAAVKGGVTASLEGIRAFIPASKLSLGFVSDKELPDYVGKRLQVRVITVDRDNNKLVLSARDVLREEQTKLVKVGSVLEGTVETIKDYGAFVNIASGVTGLLHVSQISNKRVGTPGEVLKEGQKVTVKVIKVQDGRISLSMKELEAEKEDREEKRNKENFRDNFKGDGAVTQSLGALMRAKKIL